MRWLNLSYLFFNLLSIACGLFKIRMAGTAMRIIFFFTILNYLCETVAGIAANLWRNNLPVYSTFSILSFATICVYYNYSIDVFRKSNIGLYIGALGTVLGMYNSVMIQPGMLNIYFIALESVVILALALFAITRLLLSDPPDSIPGNPHLWISITLSFSWSMTYCYLALFAYDEAKGLGIQDILVKSQLLCNSLTYFAFALIFSILVRREVAWNER